jgi:two-component system NtrC family sensor kinase
MAIQWSKFFDTGIDVIDKQHRALVAIINQAEPLLAASDAPTLAHADTLLDQLADYAATHFRTEEHLMLSQGVDPRYYEHHCAAHVRYVDQIADMRSSLYADTKTDITPLLMKYLTSWWTVHILDEDQRLAQYLRFMQQGGSAEAAFEQIGSTHPVSDPLRVALELALNELYGVVGERNKALHAVNAELKQARDRLELRVEERTHDLASALEQMKLTQAQLLQSEKMAAVGQLAAGVAHEINNPIGFINSNLGSLKTYVMQLLNVIAACEGLEADLPPSDVRRQRLECARAEADLDYLKKDVMALLDESMSGLVRVANIVQDLRDFSQVDQSEWQEADLNAALASTLNVIASKLKDKATVARHFVNLPLLRCIPAQLNQVFMNLLLNAAQAIEGQGEIAVSTGYTDDVVWVEITDSGMGMSPEVQKRIFEPFYTTKPIGQGIGLGLAVSFDIVENRHGGRIEVMRSDASGSTFRVQIPRQPQAALTEHRSEHVQ